MNLADDDHGGGATAGALGAVHATLSSWDEHVSAEWVSRLALRLLDAAPEGPVVLAVRAVLGEVSGASTERQGELLVAARDLIAPPVVSKPAAVARSEAVSPKESAEAAASIGRLETPLADLSLSDELVERLEGAGLQTMYDLLTLPVHERAVFAPVHGAGRPLPEGEVAVGGRVRRRVTVCSPDGSRRSGFVLFGAGPLLVSWHRAFRPVDLLGLAHDAKVVVAGVTNAITDPEPRQVTGARLVRAVQGVAHELRLAEDPELEDAFVEARFRLAEESQAVDDILPDALLRRYRMVGLRQATGAVAERGARAEAERRRLALDELVFLELGRALKRSAGSAEKAAGDRGIAHVIAHRGASEIDRVMEGALSDPAQLALEDIKRDLLAPTPMRRVLWGPARCRAADVALRAALHVLEGRAQVLVVCHEPQSALVMFTLWEPILRGLGHPCLLVSGELRRADREALRKAELQVVFGTPAVFEAALEWRRLGIVIAFEQAGYGGLLAAATQLRPPKPDVLVVARTPVPFERLLDAWAGADLSWLEVDDAGVPGGTIWAEDQRERAWGKLGDAALEGRQVIIAFPLTRAGTDLLDMRESAALLATLKNEVFGDLPIALFHGALSADGRRQALEDFRRGKVRVLVATTTLEIAGPMPPDTVLMLEHADRMDIQRLLGWRALVGAAGHVHYVIGLEPRPWGARAVNMMADRAKDEIVAQACPECFPVEADPGELTAPLVWGAPDRDRGLVVAARRIARHLLAVDPGLRGPQHHALARVAHGWWARHHGEDNPMPSPKAGPPRKRRRRRKKKPT